LIRRKRRAIEQGEAPPAVKLQQMIKAQVSQEVVELSGSRKIRRCREDQERRRERDAIGGPLDPAPNRPLADKLVAVAGLHGPLEGVVDATCGGLGNGRQDRRHGGSSTPQLCRHQGFGRSVTEADSQDGEIFEDFAGEQVSDQFAVSNGMQSCAVNGVATGAQEAGFGDQGTEVEIAAFDGGVVDGQLRCQYSADY